MARNRRRSSETLHHSRPGLREVDAVVATATGSEHAAMAELIGQRGKIARSAFVDRGGVTHVRDRVAFDAVRSRLQQDELRLVLAQMREHARPLGLEYGIVGTGRHRNVELGAGGCTQPALLRMTRAGIEEMPVFVDV